MQVMLLSFMGPRHGRILQALYDGAKLVVRKSKLFDLRSIDVDALKLFARWWYASPAGDTISSYFFSLFLFFILQSIWMITGYG